MSTRTNHKRYLVTPEQQLYQSYSVDEDQIRTNVHYEQPPAFFYRITGGEWNVYSCNVWDTATTDTASQAAKLDLMAQLMQLQPGQRILDVGCGWAGPLVYLCKQYGVQGVGLTLSPMQQRAAEERIAKHGVDAQVHVCHWQEYQDDRGFDAIYTDEVIVHFNSLDGFFGKAYALLKPGGLMVNKELHFVHPNYIKMTRAGAFVNDIYGTTGNYRTLADELTLLYNAGFEAQALRQIPREHYHRTLDRWISNMRTHRSELVELVGTTHYRRFHTYLKLAHLIIKNMTLDIVVGQKPSSAT
ncbi:MAG TPA: class I SAM-dependent methyltransferase [Herpetosiphonaceae bacterium]